MEIEMDYINDLLELKATELNKFPLDAEDVRIIFSELYNVLGLSEDLSSSELLRKFNICYILHCNKYADPRYQEKNNLLQSTYYSLMKKNWVDLILLATKIK